MPYRRSISTLGCAELSLAEVLALATRHSLEAVELRALGGTLDLPAYFGRTFGSPTGLAQEFRRTGIVVAAFGTSLKLVGRASDDRERFLSFVPWAEAVGVPWLRVFDGGANGASGDCIVGAETLQWWRDERRSRGWKVDLVVETHDTLFNSERIKRFLCAAPGTRILWDAHHTWRRGGEDPVATWRAIRAHVAHIHVKDSVSRSSGKLPYTYVLPGEGEFPMAPLRELLRREFAGAVSLEWERRWHPALPSLDSALTTAAEHAWW